MKCQPYFHMGCVFRKKPSRNENSIAMALYQRLARAKRIFFNFVEANTPSAKFSRQEICSHGN